MLLWQYQSPGNNNNLYPSETGVAVSVQSLIYITLVTLDKLHCSSKGSRRPISSTRTRHTQQHAPRPEHHAPLANASFHEVFDLTAVCSVFYFSSRVVRDMCGTDPTQASVFRDLREGFRRRVQHPSSQF